MVFREVDRNEVIAGLSKYFNIQELVCPHTYERFGEASWQFLNTYMLAWLLLMRTEICKAPMYINTKSQTQRGLRCIMCDIVKNKKAVYLSGHVLAEADDATVQGLTAEEARQKIKDYAKDHPEKCPCPLRLEKGVTWLHFDVMQQWGVKEMVYEFKA